MPSHAKDAGDPVAEQVADTTRRLYELGWMRGTSGNVSMVESDDPRVLAVSASGIAKHSMTSAHAVRTDDRGAALPGQELRPSAEARVHAAVIQATGARGVVHVHALSSVLAAARWPGGVPLKDSELLKGIGREANGDVVVVPVVPNSQDMEQLSADILARLDLDVPGVIVAEHGLYTWGNSLEDAVHRTESLDWLFDLTLALAAMQTRGFDR
ncbi:MAG: methylthioribulose 1-phosphate dehydratase [Actinomycetes bacterium]